MLVVKWSERKLFRYLERDREDSTMLVTIIFLVLQLIMQCSCTNSFSGSYVGCFNGDNTWNKTEDDVLISEHSDTVDSCVEECEARFYRYALLWNASNCFCQYSYIDFADGECDKPCVGNASQICGGELSYSVYDTGQNVPSPPTSLILSNNTDTSLEIQWSPPKFPNGIITSYNIKAIPVQTFSGTPILIPLWTWHYPGSTNKTKLTNLHPGTCYNISVSAVADVKYGLIISKKFCTEIGEPSLPPTPEIIKSSGGQRYVRLFPATNDNGPVSAYQVVVMYDEGLSSFNPAYLTNYKESLKQGLSYYIAAELPPDRVKKSDDYNFIVGDDLTYGKYENPLLSPNAHVHVSMGVVSTLNNVTKTRYADTSHEQHGVLILNVGNEYMNEEANSSLEVGLSVAVGVFGVLLVLSIVVFIILRQRVAMQMRCSSEHQELSLEGPIFEVESSSYVHNGYVPDEVQERVDHYKNLKDQVWNVPRNFLDVQSQLLGVGRYGNVMKGTVQQRGFPVPVAVHIIPDRNLVPAEKHSMLQDLGILIRSNAGENVIQLVGICETPDTLYVMIEQHPATLKDMLLESRTLAHGMGHGSGHSPERICSLQERQLLEAAVGIARAMNHLAQQKILHKQIAARNVLMAHGVVPKLTNFGIAQYNKGNEIPDYTRWTAQEIFRGSRYVSKSDVWSFGCLLWEISALGGTPYADIQTSEVASSVMRGLRLPQLQIVSDNLFQLMLQCWQMDLDERPSFHELTCILENILEDNAIHLNFTAYMGYHYEQYISELERQ